MARAVVNELPLALVLTGSSICDSSSEGDGEGVRASGVPDFVRTAADGVLAERTCTLGREGEADGEGGEVGGAGLADT